MNTPYEYVYWASTAKAKIIGGAFTVENVIGIGAGNRSFNASLKGVMGPDADLSVIALPTDRPQDGIYYNVAVSRAVGAMRADDMHEMLVMEFLDKGGWTRFRLVTT